MNDKKFKYLFGIFFCEKQSMSDYEVLNLLNSFNEQLDEQEEILEKVAIYCGFSSIGELVDEVMRNE